ncbi:MAG: serine/threonine protein kinase [Chromatiales bacterium]|jgi:Ser/Thr protein kinase RdoA (MazF antagonist)
MSHPYDRLSPDLILDAIDSLGFVTDGRLFNLNSYENRVIQVGIEDAAPLIAKFYRPDRWSDAAILEEHTFSLALAGEDIPVIAPIQRDGRSLFEHEGFRFAVFPRNGGRWPELDNADNLRWLGRFLARIHQLGSASRFEHRPATDAAALGREPADWLLASGMLPAHFESTYATLVTQLLEQIETRFVQVQPFILRLHGDCHPGNILWTDSGPHFVDMDDCRNGPMMQDLWMLLSGDSDAMRQQLNHLLEGYEMFRHFDDAEIQLIEPLRSLRMIHYAAWLARRWDDPAFPVAFTWFGSSAYWEEHLRLLEDQLNLIS